jgi:hypothetical protein
MQREPARAARPLARDDVEIGDLLGHGDRADLLRARHAEPERDAERR